MKTKETGYVLAVDPASNRCGVSLWKDGILIDTALLESNSPRDLFSVRLQSIALQLDLFLRRHLREDERVSTVICEGVRSLLVQICIGALLSVFHVQAAMSSTGSFVYPSSWKKYAKDRGAVGPLKDIKGTKALREIGWQGPLRSDDESDSILLYLCWRDRP